MQTRLSAGLAKPVQDGEPKYGLRRTNEVIERPSRASAGVAEGLLTEVLRKLSGNPHRSLAANFAVMHNTAQTAMMCSVEPGQGNETALQSRPRTS
jgi:hypothetical protein